MIISNTVTLKKILLVIACIILLPFVKVHGETFVLQDLDYLDKKQTLKNYDRGFYTPQVLHLKPSGTNAIKPYSKLLHLRAEISEFSSNAYLSVNGSDTTWGVSQDITEDALNALQESFNNIRNEGGKVIVRICYDPWYNGRSNVTPEHKWVLRHVEQLSKVLGKNTDIIVALEMGMHGAYGEMHSDTSITYPRVSEAVNLMLKNTPNELKILTRTGNYSAAVLGFENWGKTFHIDGEEFLQIAKAKGDTMYRVGMFNDGYLGTQYDYGTWGADCETSICREEGVAWLEKYGINTPYGGEALTTASGYAVINTPEYLAYEGFRTHTSYLNIQWNNTLIDSWKATNFKGNDFEYGNNETGFKYVEDHLGYRFVLRESNIIDSVPLNGTFKANLKIQNVGFGNVTMKSKASLIFVNKNYSLISDSANIAWETELSNINPQKILSRTITVNRSDTLTTFDGTNDIEITADLNGNIAVGDYKVYLRFYSEESENVVNAPKGIQFANDSTQYAKSFGGNYLGTFTVSAKTLGISNKRSFTNIKSKSFVKNVDNKIEIQNKKRYYRTNGKKVTHGD